MPSLFCCIAGAGFHARPEKRDVEGVVPYANCRIYQPVGADAHISPKKREAKRLPYIVYAKTAPCTREAVMYLFCLFVFTEKQCHSIHCNNTADTCQQVCKHGVYIPQRNI